MWISFSLRSEDQYPVEVGLLNRYDELHKLVDCWNKCPIYNVYINQRDAQILVNSLYFFDSQLHHARLGYLVQANLEMGKSLDYWC